MLSFSPTIGFARRSDANEISDLSRHEIEHGLRWKYTPNRIVELIEDPNRNTIVSRCNEVLLGFGVMSYRETNANLDLLAVKRDYRRRGIASGLVDWLLAVAGEAGIHSVYVQVRKSNRGAEALYREHGFYRIDELHGYYQGKETGVILCRSLRPVFDAT